MIFTSPATAHDPPLPARDLDDLVRRSRNGDRAAFNALVRHYHAGAYRLACRMLRDREAAEDATQEVFLKAWQNLHRFRGASKFSTWLHSIAVNHCLDAARRQAREALRTQPLFLDKEEREEMKTPSNAASPTLSWDMSLVIQEALQRLPEKLQVIVVLHYYGGYSVPDIAGALGLPVRTVRHRLYTAMDRLQRTLGNTEEVG